MFKLYVWNPFSQNARYFEKELYLNRESCDDYEYTDANPTDGPFSFSKYASPTFTRDVCEQDTRPTDGTNAVEITF